MTRTLSRFGLGIFVLMLASAAFAQYAGSIRGTITDSTGAIVPGATVTFTNEATRNSRSVVTDAKGGYYFGTVQSGVYTIRVEIPGFKTTEQKGIRISPSETAGRDFVLEVGAQTEKIEVTAQREMIQTQTGAREGLITSAQIENLSVIGRSPLELLRILPGAVTPDQNTLESVGNLTGTSNTNAYSVNGMRGSNNVVTLDGSKLIDIGSNNGVIVVPNNDMVSEVKVQSSNYAAEYGSAGVQVNAVTKGGGSEFHGTVYDYIRHYKLAANDRSNTLAGVDRPKSEFQYPGANLSGPILIPGTGFNKSRDKAFFFLAFELQKQKVDSGSSFLVVPTAGQRQGLFNDYQTGQNLNQPTTVLIPQGYPGAGTVAPNGDLRPYMDPFGVAYMSKYPMPNYQDPNNRYNYVFNALQPQDRTQFVARFDYNFTENTKAYLRLARDTESFDFARGAWWDASSVELPSPLTHKNLGRSVTFDLTSVLSPTTTNEFLFTYSKLKLDIFFANPEAASLTSIGFPDYGGWYGQAGGDALPNMIDWGNTGSRLYGVVGDKGVFAYNDTLMFGDTFTKVLNTHAIKAGVMVERVHKDQNSNNDETITFNVGPGWIPGSTGSAFGDMLVGRPASAQQGTLLNTVNFELWNFDFFAQDSWKIKKNFTLEYGVRLSKWTNNVETKDLGGYFDPSFYDPSQSTFLDADKRYLNGVRYVSLGQTDRALIDSRPIFVMPRVNFAWDLKGDGDWIIRGGGGKFYSRPMGNAEYDVLRLPPNAYNTSLDAWAGEGLGGGTGGANTGLTYSNLALVNPTSLVGRQGYQYSVNADSIDYPHYWTASLGVAKRLPWDNVVEVSYVSSYGRGLLQRQQDNILEEGELLSGTVGNSDLSNPLHRSHLSSDVVNTFRRYPAVGAIGWWNYAGTSDYHSMQVTLSRQTSSRFQYFVAYTFGKVLGTEPGEYNDIDPYNPRERSYGVLPTDRTHILNASYNLALPDAIKGDGNGVLKGLLNGWQISGISSFSSGLPLRLTLGGDIVGDGPELAWYGTPDHPNGSGSSSIAPIYSCNPAEGGSNKPGEKYLNINCLQLPSFPNSGQYVSPYYIRTPNRQNHDLTIFKNFNIGSGGKRLQFRAGFFNIFNQAFPARVNEDLDLQLNTTCNVRANGVPNGAGGTDDNVCDPTGGYSFTEQTIANFGKVLTKRGHRVIELALKFYF